MGLPFASALAFFHEQLATVDQDAAAQCEKWCIIAIRSFRISIRSQFMLHRSLYRKPVPVQTFNFRGIRVTETMIALRCAK